VTRALSPIQQRGLALSLFGVALALLWLGLIAPVAEYFGHSAERRQGDLDSLSRDRALISQDSNTQAALSAIGKSPRWARFYDTQKPDKAVLQMQSDLREVFKAPNNPTSMTAVPVVVEGALTRIATKITLSLTIDQLTEALARLHSHAQLLRIESLSIQAPDYQMPDSNPTLSIQAEIVGFMVTAAKERA
jgi:Type II secretion system (T2SS), protein M subtype b